MGKISKRFKAAKDKVREHVLSLALGRNYQASANRAPSRSGPSSSGNRTTTVVVKARELGDAPTRRAPQLSTKRSRQPRRELQSNIQKMRREDLKPSPSQSEDAATFVNVHRREIGLFGATGLEKKKAKEYEVQDLVRLGCKPPKRNKEPIGIIQRRRANEKRREAAQRQANLESGMLIRSQRKKQK